jgi:3'-5' exoribonuclease
MLVDKTFVNAIRDRDQVNAVFLVKEKITAMAKNGKPYLTLRLMDKTGEIEGRVWDNVDTLSATFERDDFVSIRGKASVYLGKMQLIVSELLRVPESDVVLADFLPEAQRSIDEMCAELGDVTASIANPHLRGLLESFFGDREFLAQYRVAPAAKGMHHVYLGGLLEHSLAVVRLIDSIVPLYPGLNRDLLVAGALLHDVGKVREMSYLRSFDYTDEGKLLGHITIGVEMIHEKIRTIEGFPPELSMLLKHMILSHHGQYDYGSPKRPKTVEATILNYLDDLDSKINGIRSHIGKEPDNDSRWTSYHRLYDRYFYRERRDVPEEGRDAVAAAPPPPAAPPVQPPAPPRVPAQREREERKSFNNSPFQGLKEGTLDLFRGEEEK